MAPQRRAEAEASAAAFAAKRAAAAAAGEPQPVQPSNPFGRALLAAKLRHWRPFLRGGSLCR